VYYHHTGHIGFNEPGSSRESLTRRITLDRITAAQPYLRGAVTEAPSVLKPEDTTEVDALQRNVRSTFQQVVQLSPVLSDDLNGLATNIGEPGRLADFIASSLSTLSTVSIEDVASASHGTRWFQLYMYRDRGVTTDLIERAANELGVKVCSLWGMTESLASTLTERHVPRPHR